MNFRDCPFLPLHAAHPEAAALAGFINHLSYREKSGWKAFQTNFTTGVRGSLHTNQVLTRLETLEVKNQNT